MHIENELLYGRALQFDGTISEKIESLTKHNIRSTALYATAYLIEAGVGPIPFGFIKFRLTTHMARYDFEN